MSRTLIKMIMVAFICAAPLQASAQRSGPSTRMPASPTATAAAPAAPTPSQNSSSKPPVDSAYVLGVGDVVELGLVGRSDFAGQARIDANGDILMPYIGKVKATGRTALELADDVRQALIKGGFFSDPVVRAEVVGISSRYATALGAVGSPGLIPLDKNYRLSELLAKIGGRGASGVDYVVLTHPSGESKHYPFDKLATGGPDDDPIVLNGDKIFIPSAETEVFFISGQVNAAGAYPVTQGLTVRMAIARGGGVSENGSENKVKIVRDGTKLKSVKLNDPIKVGDVITIGERLF